MQLRIACVRLSCVAALWFPPVLNAAEIVEPVTGLTLREALLLAEQHNPDLQASRLGLLGFDGRRQQAALGPANEVSVDVENALGTGDLQGLDSAEFTLALSHVFELGDKRQYRLGLVDAQQALVSATIEEQRLELAAEVLDRFVQVAADQGRLNLARRGEELAQNTYAAVNQRVDAALAPGAERHRARANLEKARSRKELAELAQRNSMAWLVSLWDAAAPSYSGVAADLFALPELLSHDEMVQLLESSPRARLLTNERALRDAELLLAQSRTSRDIAVGGGVRYLRETSDTGLVMSLSVPLGNSGRNQGAIQEARAALEHTDALGQAERFRARAVLSRYYNALTEARAKFEALRDRVMPELESALQGTRAAYETGRYGYLELADAQLRLIEVQEELIDAATRYHKLLVSIEQLTGQALTLSAAPTGAKS
jgi:cobalt-zinc-cadmium efflux system outer membrane protein